MYKYGYYYMGKWPLITLKASIGFQWPPLNSKWEFLKSIVHVRFFGTFEY